MKKALLWSTLTFGLLAGCNSPSATQEIKAKGIFREIAVEKQNETVKTLEGGDKKKKKAAAEAVLARPNEYNPPVLYALSRVLFQQGDKDTAAFWFYVAQLRGRYDANRCMDNTARQAVSILNQEYGPKINKYTFSDMPKLERTMQAAVDFVRGNQEAYDPRWINLHGMWAVQAGLSGEEQTKPLSQPEAKWPEIKKETIEDYQNDFIDYLKSRDED